MLEVTMRLSGWCVVGACVFALGLPAIAQAQKLPAQASPPQPAVAEQPADPLGRSTPRGTVLGFLNAARRGEDELARQYLNTRLSDSAAETLAHQLFVVLDARLPARLTQVSDAPEGSRSNPLSPDREIVGTIADGSSQVEIVVERVGRAKSGSVWLFSSDTLDAIPSLYEQIARTRANALLPRFLFDRRVGGVPLFEWLAVLLSLPVLYLATVLLNRALTPLIRLMWRRLFGESDLLGGNVLPAPARLLLLALVGRWLLSSLPLSLLMRQFWTNAARLLTIGAVVWLLIVLNGQVEQYIRRRLPPSNVAAAAALLRLGRRGVDLLLIFAGLLAILRHFSIDPTPALAGLGVGGIAVALAAQKTLENVIAGASLIFDQAVRVGDFLKMGEIVGTVDHIGLRSTRIRTLDRTVVSVPNSQIANASLETISARDKYWFHPVVGLRYETTPEQLHSVVDGIRHVLDGHPSIDPESVRVRLLRLGAFSLDVEVFAYVRARDWNHFLEIQEQLLFKVTEIVNDAGTEIAFPSQTMYVAGAHTSLPAPGSIPTP
jgi:MscS family membrane protein